MGPSADATAGVMAVTVRASTGVEIAVWREGALFHAAHLAGTKREPQVCIALDLFEVIAELAGLNLEVPQHSREALELAASVQARLSPP